MLHPDTGDLQQCGINVSRVRSEIRNLRLRQAGRPFQDRRDQQAAFIDFSLVTAMATGRTYFRQSAIVTAIPEVSLVGSPTVVELFTVQSVAVSVTVTV